MAHIVFYDGVCGLCNRSVRWLVRHDRRRVLRYASLQSEFAKKALKGTDLDITSGTIIFRDGSDIYTKSDAVIAILRRMGGIYRLARVLRVIPRALRDDVYDWIARNRYRWFGKHDRTPRPSPEVKELFIDRPS